MKNLKEFKYQHQLDATVPDRRSRTRTRFNLVCGMLMGGLTVGVLWPAASKWVAKDSPAAHAMPAKKLVALADIPSNVDVSRTSVLDTDDSNEAEPPLLIQTVPSQSVEDKPSPRPATVATKADVSRPRMVKPPKKFEKFVKATAREREKEKPVRIATLEKSIGLQSGSGSRTLEKNVDLVEESGTGLTARDAQDKTDAALLKIDGLTIAAADSASYTTLVNTHYEKSTLANCKVRCLLKTKDKDGHSINAIINGPSFADILDTHKGTINLTGKMTLVKGHEFFMVQNITFNLGTAKAGTSAPAPSKAQTAAPLLKADRGLNSPYTGPSEGYEDLDAEPLPVN